MDSYSAVSGDPRAFTPWNDTFIAPVSWYGYNEEPGNYQETNGSAAVLVSVDVDSRTLTTIGRVGHPVVEQCEGKPIPIERGAVEVQSGGFDSAGTTVPTTSTETTAATEEATTTTVPQTTVPDTTVDTGDAEAEFVRPEEEPPADEAIVPPGPDGDYCWSYQPEIRRSVIINGNLYTVSDAGVAVNELDGLATVTWIPFDR